MGPFWSLGARGATIGAAETAPERQRAVGTAFARQTDPITAPHRPALAAGRGNGRVRGRLFAV